MNDLERARLRRRERAALVRPQRAPEITVEAWIDDNGEVDLIATNTTDTTQWPIGSSSERLNYTFDMLWHSTCEGDDRGVYLAFVGRDGRVRTRRDIGELEDPRNTWAHVWWQVKKAWQVAEPLLDSACVSARNDLRRRLKTIRAQVANGSSASR